MRTASSPRFRAPTAGASPWPVDGPCPPRSSSGKLPTPVSSQPPLDLSQHLREKRRIYEGRIYALLSHQTGVRIPVALPSRGASPASSSCPASGVATPHQQHHNRQCPEARKKACHTLTMCVPRCRRLFGGSECRRRFFRGALRGYLSHLVVPKLVATRSVQERFASETELPARSIL
jgi:hypothetical protein